MQICNERPAYNDGRRAFPTCGNTCARALEAAKLEAAKKTPRSSGHPYSSGGSNNHRSSTTSSYQTRQTTIKMCDVRWFLTILLFNISDLISRSVMYAPNVKRTARFSLLAGLRVLHSCSLRDRWRCVRSVPYPSTSFASPNL